MTDPKCCQCDADATNLCDGALYCDRHCPVDPAKG